MVLTMPNEGYGLPVCGDDQHQSYIRSEGYPWIDETDQSGEHLGGRWFDHTTTAEPVEKGKGECVQDRLPAPMEVFVDFNEERI